MSVDLLDKSPVDQAFDDFAAQERQDIIARESTDPDPEARMAVKLAEIQEELTLLRILNWLDNHAPSLAREVATERLLEIRRNQSGE